MTFRTRIDILTAFAFTVFPVLGARAEMVGGYNWISRQINNDSVELCSGLYPAIEPSPTGAVTIPESVRGGPFRMFLVSASWKGGASGGWGRRATAGGRPKTGHSAKPPFSAGLEDAQRLSPIGGWKGSVKR